MFTETTYPPMYLTSSPLFEASISPSGGRPYPMHNFAIVNCTHTSFERFSGFNVQPPNSNLTPNTSSQHR